VSGSDKIVVTIVVEVTQRSAWSGGETLDYVREQAGKEATSRVRRLLDGQEQVRVVGEPSVTIAFVGPAK